jgi:curved DNA-binding protein CbpA
MNMKRDYYEIIGVDPKATPDEIKQVQFPVIFIME